MFYIHIPINYLPTGCVTMLQSTLIVIIYIRIHHYMCVMVTLEAGHVTNCAIIYIYTMLYNSMYLELNTQTTTMLRENSPFFISLNHVSIKNEHLATINLSGNVNRIYSQNLR